jgi:predicted GIY-YIG superfamily endonuclease
MSWSVYVLVSASRAATYVGVTTDLERRLAQHNGELPGGARSTRRDRPWTLGVVHGTFDERAGRCSSTRWACARCRTARC